jgi:hypothetical protein
MSSSEHHEILHEIVRLFEALAAKLEHAIEAFAQDDSGTVDLAALHRAKDAAQRGIHIVRNATDASRSAFD